MEFDDDIIYLGPALQYFLRNMKMYIRYNSIEYDVADVIPHKDKKYMNYDNLTMLFSIYIKLNDLYDEFGECIILDDLLIKVFNLPALNYSANTSMKKAVQKGLTDKELNIFGIMGLDYKIDIKLIRTILKYNIKNTDDIISDDDYGQLRYQDHIIDDIFETLNKCLRLKAKEIQRKLNDTNFKISQLVKFDEASTFPVDKISNTFLIEFIYNSLNTLTLSNALQINNRINLISNIISDRVISTIESMKKISPRCNNCDYYITAKEFGSSTIQYIIEKKIISDMWYEKQVLVNCVGDSYYDIMLYMINNIFNKYF